MEEESLFGYLESTYTKEAWFQLYSDESRGMYAARTILQRLPELGRQFVLRLVASSNAPLPMERIQQWCASNNKPSTIQHALTRMETLCVSTTDKTKGMIQLTTEFHSSIQKALTSFTSSPWPEVTPTMYQTILMKQRSEKKSSEKIVEEKQPTLEQLEAYTQSRWDAVLHFLVGDSSTSKNNIEKPPPAVIHFLELTGLMQRDPDYTSKKGEAPLVISSKGYEFMLQDVHVQVWQLLLQYFSSLEHHRKFEELRHEATLFLLCLSYCKVGCAYAASSLSNKHERTLMKDLKRFGLLYVTKVAGITLFYPTRVAVDLVVGSLTAQTSSSTSKRQQLRNSNIAMTDDSFFRRSATQTRALEDALSQPEPPTSHIAILVQTNFHVCAYITSEIHVKMLSLFCDLRDYRRLPNVIMTRLTRDSIKAAFSLGITAAQIIRFLKMHAHPQTEQTTKIPQNVEDQIWLWDRERTRVSFQEIYIVPCNNRNEFITMKQYAMDQNAYAWSNSSTNNNTNNNTTTTTSNSSNNRLMVQYEKAEMIMSHLRKLRSSRNNTNSNATTSSNSK